MYETSIYKAPPRSKAETSRESRYVRFLGFGIIAVILGAGLVDMMMPEDAATGETPPEAVAFVDVDE